MTSARVPAPAFKFGGCSKDVPNTHTTWQGCLNNGGRKHATGNVMRQFSLHAHMAGSLRTVLISVFKHLPLQKYGADIKNKAFLCWKNPRVQEHICLILLTDHHPIREEALVSLTDLEKDTLLYRRINITAGHLCTSFPQEPFQDLSCCCCPSWLVTYQETSEEWQAAPLPSHAPVPPGFPLEEGYLSCAGCHSTPCLYLGPRTEHETDDVHSR